MSDTKEENKKLRPIKSYVVRGGRLTSAQELAMKTMWPVFGLNVEQGLLDWPAIFKRDAERVLEIGFGMGDSLIKMAQENPRQDFIGIDVHPPGIGTLLRDIKENELSNIRVFQHDATIVLKECVEDNSLDKMQIFFPDPWHKKRHHKRRLIKPDFIQGIRQKLKPGGILHLATDWENYAEQMLEVLSAAEGFQNCFGVGQIATEHDRPSTKFERRGERLGHGVWDFVFKKL
jgi:tRNA (guanine-N7-)-methyltransferase